MPPRSDHIRAGLLGAVIGDALASRFEGADPGFIRVRLREAPSPEALAPGPCSAATETLLATVASLIEHPRFDGEDMGARILKAASGPAWERLVPLAKSSTGNAAAVRSVAVGLLWAGDEEWLRWVAEEAANLTHPHALGCEGAVLVALATALALETRGRKIDVAKFVDQLKKATTMHEYRSRLDAAGVLLRRHWDGETVVERLGNNASALGSVVTAMFCFLEHSDDFVLAVRRALGLGGNVTALATMTGAMAGAHLGLDAIPTAWREGLPKAYPDSRILELADALAARVEG